LDKKIQEILKRSVTNISQNYVDEYVEENAKFRSNSGLKEKIIRSTNGKCCEWCTKIAGIYSYPAPKDVYRRHDNCDCTVTYVSEKGSQDVYTKQQLKAEEVAERIEKLAKLSEEEKEKARITEWIREHTYEKKKIKYDEGYDKQKHKKEIECAEWMSEMFGGDITCLNEVEIHEMPDFIWNKKTWEEKSAESPTAADRNVRKACHQISSVEGVETGGIIITLNCKESETEECIEAAKHRLKRETYVKKAALIIKRGNNIIKIIEK
jgi:hypothetical protein